MNHLSFNINVNHESKNKAQNPEDRIKTSDKQVSKSRKSTADRIYLVMVGGSRGSDPRTGVRVERPLASFAYFATWKSKGPAARAVAKLTLHK